MLTVFIQKSGFHCWTGTDVIQMCSMLTQEEIITFCCRSTSGGGLRIVFFFNIPHLCWAAITVCVGDVEKLYLHEKSDKTQILVQSTNIEIPTSQI